MFLALSFTDFELYAEEGVLLPNVFYYPCSEGAHLEPGAGTKVAATPRRKSTPCAPLSKMLACSRVSLRESRTDGPPGYEVVRVFAIPMHGNEAC